MVKVAGNVRARCGARWSFGSSTLLAFAIAAMSACGGRSALIDDAVSGGGDTGDGDGGSNPGKAGSFGTGGSYGTGGTTGGSYGTGGTVGGSYGTGGTTGGGYPGGYAGV